MKHTTAEEAKKAAKPLTPKVKELIGRSKSLILATVNAEGTPNASYAPFIQIDTTFYILVSFMAKHTQNLAEGRKTSAMIIEDESATKQIYARERLTFEASILNVERYSDSWNDAVAKLREAHGKVVDVIADMKDFILIGLQPVKGSYVNGFGSAYSVNEKLEILEHRNDQNHQSR